MEGQEKVKLFREKNLEAMDSPESLNDYLRVTSPGVWLIMAAVIAVLVGAILWGVFGRINTTTDLALATAEGKTVCYVPYDELKTVMTRGIVTVEGRDYQMKVADDYNVLIVSEGTNPYVRVLGSLQVGDVMVEIPVEADLPDGYQRGTVITESLQPISLLLK